MKYDIFDSYWDGVLVVDGDQNLIYCNEVAAAFFNQSLKRAQSSYNKPIAKLATFKNESTHKPVDFTKWKNSTYQLVEIATAKESTRTAKEKVSTAMMSVHKIDKENNQWIAFLRDTSVEISLQKKYNRELKIKEKHIEQLKELDAVKDRFMLLTTHELRTPLSALVGSCDILKSVDLSPGDRAYFTNVIFEQASHLMTLVNNILDYTRIGTGKMDYCVEKLSLSEIVRDSISSLRDLANNNKIVIDFVSKEDKEFMCYFDQQWLGVVLRNILHNAIKFNKYHGRVDVCVFNDKKNDLCVVEIEDTGNGIDEKRIHEIFSGFQTTEQLDHHQSGSGLSLPLSKQILEALGGKIEVKSALGKGTCFKIILPTTEVLPKNYYKKPPQDSGDLAA